MRRTVDFPQSPDGSKSADNSGVEALTRRLEEDGLVVLPGLVSAEQLRGMQQAFDIRLRRIRWNNFDGYQKTEPYRHMVEDVLMLHQGFVDIGLHPIIRGVLNNYLGTGYELTEAKGWKSIPTKRDFHGWHGDAWYEQDTPEIPKEVKLAFYLTDVTSGAFNFIKGSHRKQHPRLVRNNEVANVEDSLVMKLMGPAGTAFLFDTSGVHRQGVPMLEPRRACFYNYHDPDVRLQKEEIQFYRYHPLLLNAAFLGNLSAEQQRILGFGNKKNYLPEWERPLKHGLLQKTFQAALNFSLRTESLRERVAARLRHTFGSK